MLTSTRLLQQSLETAAEDIACQGKKEWSHWVLYLICALEDKIADENSINDFLVRFQRDLGHYVGVRG